MRGRRLYVPKGQDVRPASDKVRQAVFNMLAAYGLPEGAHVLDGFCGSGAYGLEALSRGASGASFIDLNIEPCRKNVEALGLNDVSHLLRKDILKPGPRPEAISPAALVFLDPPYRRSLMSAALRALKEGGWWADDCLFVLELEKNASPDLAGMAVEKEKTYGDTKILTVR